MIRDRRAQSAVWGFLGMLVFIAIASGFVDITGCMLREIGPTA